MTDQIAHEYCSYKGWGLQIRFYNQVDDSWSIEERIPFVNGKRHLILEHHGEH